MTTKPAPADKPATKAPAPNTPCACGCGQPTVRAEATYISGHDARHAGQIGRAVADGKLPESKIAEIFGAQPKLKAKAEGVVATAARKAAEKDARAKAREAAKQAAAQAMAAAGF